MNCDRCGRYVPLKAQACPTCDPANAGVTRAPREEQRIAEAEQFARQEKRSLKQTLIWMAVAAVVLIPLILLGQTGHGRRSLPEPLRKLSEFFGWAGFAALFLQSVYRVFTLSPRRQTKEWVGALQELGGWILLILGALAAAALGIARRGGN